VAVDELSSLIESMVKRDVIGYAVLLARKSARPQICVLLAQKEQLNNSGHQERAAGLHVIQLPFADDIREIGITSTVSAIIPPSKSQALYWVVDLAHYCTDLRDDL
jgi:ATP-dependent DNA helicase 2 subunit 1